MTFQGFAMQNGALRTTKSASPRCLLETHRDGGRSNISGSFLLLILSTSFSVPLRLLDAILYFHSRCSNTTFQDILRILFRPQKPFKNIFLCQSDTRVQCQIAININLQVLLLLYNQKLVQATNKCVSGNNCSMKT